MNNVQEIFNKVIVLGYYTKEYIPNKQCRFMCYALEYALKAGDITLLDYDKCITEIKEYVDCTRYEHILNLEDLLQHVYQRSISFQDTLGVYKNWNNKPEIK